MGRAGMAMPYATEWLQLRGCVLARVELQKMQHERLLPPIATLIGSLNILGAVKEKLCDYERPLC